MAIDVCRVIVVKPYGLQPYDGLGPCGKRQRIAQLQLIARRVQIPGRGVYHHIVVDEIFPVFGFLHTLLGQGGLAVRDVRRCGVCADVIPIDDIGVGVGFLAFQLRVAAHVYGVVQADDTVLELSQVVQRIVSLVFSFAVQIGPRFNQAHFTREHVVNPHLLFKSNFAVELLQHIVVETDRVAVVVEQYSVVKLPAGVAEVDIHRVVHIYIRVQVVVVAAGSRPGAADLLLELLVEGRTQPRSDRVALYDADVGYGQLPAVGYVVPVHQRLVAYVQLPAPGQLFPRCLLKGDAEQRDGFV